MNKRKPDDEFANINLSFIDSDGKEKIIYCPESKDSKEMQSPNKSSMSLNDNIEKVKSNPTPVQKEEALQELEEQHFTIHYDDTGYTYDTIFLPYFIGAKKITIEDPYIRVTHQVQNFLRFCETALKAETVKEIKLITSYDDQTRLSDLKDQLEDLKQSLLDRDIVLDIEFNTNMHDREVYTDNGWSIKIGRGLDFYQKPSSWFEVGTSDLSLRKCLETNVDIFKIKKA